MAEIWSYEESKIDFVKEPERAARCTICFAAMELKKYLTKMLCSANIMVTDSAATGDIFIRLDVASLIDDGESFEWCPEQNGLLIRGEGRTGVLYGVYEFLRWQGWRWFEPGEQGEIGPSLRAILNLPQKHQSFSPALKNGRGFEFEGLLKESSELWLWMARNRLNLAAGRPHTTPLLNKLGMQKKLGGHIFEEILDPDRRMPSGKILWEEHPEWYGTPKNQQKTKENALKTQFCVSQPQLIDFLAKEVLKRLGEEWKNGDRIDIWGFDTWGDVCNCEQCKKLGNGSDQILYFLSAIRKCLDDAKENGELDRSIRLVTTAYEGTSTKQPPKNPVPRNLLDAGDYVVFCPILRCYEHNLDDSSCGMNQDYWKALKGWCNSGISVMMLEYYNVSKFEDLPLVFSERLRHDLPTYYYAGVSGLTYMHLPIVNWGMRALTQTIYARLAWNPEEDVDQIMKDYFVSRYKGFADVMEQAYGLIENAWRKCSSWRSWSQHNILQNLLAWNGERPIKPLDTEYHFSNSDDIEISGRQSIESLKRAMGIINKARSTYRKKIQKECCTKLFPSAVNPVEQQKQSTDHLEYYLNEDRRLLIYGIDTMSLMTEMTAYYNALLFGNSQKAEIAWKRIEALENKMSGYYLPLTFDNPNVGLISKDALTRTQLHDVIFRCRCNRDRKN